MRVKKRGVGLAKQLLSSPRTQGPILRGRSYWKKEATSVSQINCVRWLWVPAFAGTTGELSASILKEPTHLRVLAAMIARALLETSRPLCQRAQGRPGARCTRGLVCNL